MSNPGPKQKARPAPFSLRFSEPEKALLREKAAGMPLGRYIRAAALGDAVEARKARRAPVRDGEALGRLLGLLGQSRLSNNLNQLARAANEGSLPLTDDVEADLRRACADVAQMRALLMLALGLRTLDDVADETPLAPAFEKAAKVNP